MVIQNIYPNLSNIVHTDFELGRVMCTVAAADPGITEVPSSTGTLPFSWNGSSMGGQWCTCPGKGAGTSSLSLYENLRVYSLLNTPSFAARMREVQLSSIFEHHFEPLRARDPIGIHFALLGLYEFILGFLWNCHLKQH